MTNFRTAHVAPHSENPGHKNDLQARSEGETFTPVGIQTNWERRVEHTEELKGTLSGLVQPSLEPLQKTTEKQPSLSRS
jgi:hypothetical protein